MASWPAPSTPTSTAPSKVLDDLAEVGIDLIDVTRQLEEEGVSSFSKSFDELIELARHEGRRPRGRLGTRRRCGGSDERIARRRRRRARRVRRRVVVEAFHARARATRSRSPSPVGRPPAPATSGWPPTPAARSTGGRSTSTGATSGACPTTTPTRTTAWPARRCSTGSGAANATYPMRCEEVDAYQLRLGELGRFDLIHLGLGPDGHTASLFPNSPGPRRRSRAGLVALNEDPSGRNPHQRMTLTFAGIARARLALVTVAGEAKAEALAAVVARRATCPARTIDAERVIWLADPAAASLLRLNIARHVPA